MVLRAADRWKRKKRAIVDDAFPNFTDFEFLSSLGSVAAFSTALRSTKRNRRSVALVPPQGHHYHFRVHRAAAPPSRALVEMLINLVPDFFAVLESTDRLAAYERYFAAHRRLLEAYWNNYVVDPDGPHFQDVVNAAVHADRRDLRAMLERTDVFALARDAEQRCASLLAADVAVDVVLMVGVGAANAGELVIDARGVAFVCLEHFTGVANEETDGLGLDPELVPLWLAHEYAHAIRYTSPASRSVLRGFITAANGEYSYWDTGRRIRLRELLMNEGLAVHVSRAISPGHAAWEYFGYERRQYARIRELEQIITRSVVADLDRAALGLRLRYLSGGMSEESRTIDGRYVLPERSGYYLGARLCEAGIDARGLAWAVRASDLELSAYARSAAVSA
jgi:hypothetical protein